MVGGGPVCPSPGGELVAPVGGGHQAEVEAQATTAGQGRGPAREGRGMSERLAEWVIDVMGENWKTFRAHAPAGAYLPVGQLDGDCRECGAAWPCPTVTKII